MQFIKNRISSKNKTKYLEKIRKIFNSKMLLAYETSSYHFCVYDRLIIYCDAIKDFYTFANKTTHMRVKMFNG
jgi:hypothetical protein